jgi:hypothetical protein
MTRPIFFGTETDIAVLILALKIIAKGIPISFGLLLIEAAARKDMRAPADCDHRFQLIATKRSD